MVTSRLTGTRPRVLAAALSVALIASLVLGVALSDSTGALCLAPFLLLVGVLALGRYPGERTIRRLGGMGRQVPRKRPANLRGRSLPLAVRRVGREIAFALASRPPPVLAHSR